VDRALFLGLSRLWKSPVGASLLAMVANDNAYILDKRSLL
jgi:hypothetical protein